MKKIRALVSGAGGESGQGVLKALQQSDLPVELYAMCIRRESAGLHQPGVMGFVAPFSHSPEYIPFVTDLIEQFGIDAFFPTVDSEIGLVSAAKRELTTRTGASILVGEPAQVAVTQDKSETIRFLQQHGFEFPKTFLANDSNLLASISSLGFPVVVKPRSGNGSRDIHLVNSATQLAPWIGNSRYLVQEWLDPENGEFSTGIYIGRDGQWRGSCTLKRELRGGSTVIAQRVSDRALEQPLEEIAEALGLTYLNIQSMRRGDHLIPFEFNGRLSGSTAIVARVFNAPEMFIKEYVLGESVEKQVGLDQFTAIRYYEEVFVSPNQLSDIPSYENGSW